MVLINSTRALMFNITELDTSTGLIVVEDQNFGLRFEFTAPNVISASVVDEYDLQITLPDGAKKIIPILKR